MRCKNCGWQNPEGLTACERCSSPLEVAGSANMDTPEHPDVNAGFNTSLSLHSTVRESSAWNLHASSMESGQTSHAACADSGMLDCASCGYPLSPGMNVCPQCGKSQHHVQEFVPRQGRSNKQLCSKCGGTVMPGTRFCPTCGEPLRKSGTVNAWDNPQCGAFCSLRPLSWERESIEHSTISYSGERIVLNRSNTDPNNQTITSREQAVLTRDGNDWYIEDLSEQHSTMLRVSRKTKLHRGDVIALGNRLFEFED